MGEGVDSGAEAGLAAGACLGLSVWPAGGVGWGVRGVSPCQAADGVSLPSGTAGRPLVLAVAPRTEDSGDPGLAGSLLAAACLRWPMRGRSSKKESCTAGRAAGAAAAGLATPPAAEVAAASEPLRLLSVVDSGIVMNWACEEGGRQAPHQSPHQGTLQTIVRSRRYPLCGHSAPVDRRLSHTFSTLFFFTKRMKSGSSWTSDSSGKLCIRAQGSLQKQVHAASTGISAGMSGAEEAHQLVSPGYMHMNLAGLNLDVDVCCRLHACMEKGMCFCCTPCTRHHACHEGRTCRSH